MCYKKYLRRLFQTIALSTIKKYFSRFQNGDFNQNVKIRSGQSSATHNDSIRDLLNNNPRITTKVITERLNVDSSAFRHLKHFEITQNF